MERLAGAVLLQAIKDWESQKYQSDICEFLTSDWFSILVEAAGLEMEPAAIKSQIESGSYQQVSMRAAYR